MAGSLLWLCCVMGGSEGSSGGVLGVRGCGWVEGGSAVTLQLLKDLSHNVVRNVL